MNPVRDILDYSSSQPNHKNKNSLSAEELKFMKMQAVHSPSEIMAACQAKLDLGLEYFYAIQQQLLSAQRAWSAVITEKKRYDAIGWQTGSVDFARALHTCLYTIPDTARCGELGVEPAVKGQADLSSDSGSIPVVYDAVNDLPDYEHSIYESIEFEDWVDLANLDPAEESEQNGLGNHQGEEITEKQNENVEEQTYELANRDQYQAWNEVPLFDPWTPFLNNQQPPHNAAPGSHKRDRGLEHQEVIGACKEQNRKRRRIE
ncbi:uncharacterized protein E0L32_010808 [Thyridium curvatum]|uniref:Uncharacterized protein n=1 Tax=Thyridium curvatum TaxID=1093900 RepID=A0A507AR20_9PEZI|nr:uncharacterized protein E0L32_010808 [Thyridium curvatum]TPX07311.1 hypothetical protein E0L32_010808 [Thyridium curvatum]